MQLDQSRLCFAGLQRSESGGDFPRHLLTARIDHAHDRLRHGGQSLVLLTIARFGLRQAGLQILNCDLHGPNRGVGRRLRLRQTLRHVLHGAGDFALHNSDGFHSLIGARGDALHFTRG